MEFNFDYMSVKQKINLANHPNTPAEELQELATDDSSIIRYYVAKNPKNFAYVLRSLSQDTNMDVRCRVASNPSSPEDILRYLAKDAFYWVRRSVIKNPRISINNLVVLFEYEKNLKNPDTDVIRDLYTNKKLPIGIKRVIETLYRDWL